MDKALLIGSFTYVGFFFTFCIIAQFVEVSIKKRQLSYLFLIANLAFCIIAYYSTDNSDGWDLNRYYIEIDRLRKHNFSYALRYGHYKETVLANLLFYLISRTNNNYLLQVCAVFISFGILSYIIVDLKFKKSHRLSTVLLYFLMLFGIISFSTLLLGVRWILSLSIAALAAYKEEKKPFNIISVALYVISMMIHNGILLLIIVRLISIFKFKWIKFIVVFFMLILPYFEKFFAKFSYLSYAYSKLMTYSSLDLGDLRVFVVKICYLICFVCIAFFQRKDKRLKSCITNYQYNYLAAIIGSINVSNLMERSLGVYYLAFSDSIVDALENRNFQIIKYVLMFLSIGMYMYQFVFFKTFWRFRIL